jgi:hypothetical protein
MHYRKRVLCRVSEVLGKALKTLDKGFTECHTRQRRLGKQCIGKAFFAEYFFSGTRQTVHVCRVFDTRQTCLCRLWSCAECPALGKSARYREPYFAECGYRQSLLCRVPDKRHSTKSPTLGKASDSDSNGEIINRML